MARDRQIEQRLMVWAEWLTVGDGSGYPTMSVLHPEWSPPSPGVLPTMKVSAPSTARQTHRAVGMLSIRLANTLIVHYCMKLPLADQAQRLGCGTSTIHARIEVAHRRLRRLLLDPDGGEPAGEFYSIDETATFPAS